MNRPPRLIYFLLLTAAFCSARVEAQKVVGPRATLTPSLGGGFAAPGLSIGGILESPAPLAAPSLTPALAPALSVNVLSAPAMSDPAAAIEVFPAALSAARAAPASGAAPRESASQSEVAPALSALQFSAAASSDRHPGADRGRATFDGGIARAAVPAAAPARGRGAPKGFIKNFDGVWVGGRVAEQSRWIDSLFAELAPTVDLGSVMDVMDDAYDDSRFKLTRVEQIARDREITDSNVHLEGTRQWVDATLVDDAGRNIAVQSHRVYFHPSPTNPASEIAEGIRRVGKYLEQAKKDYAPGGAAELETKKSFANVELSFDTRGYEAIADFLRGKESEFRATFGDRFRFHYTTEPKLASAQIRSEFNRLVEKYGDQPEGVMNIVDGVTYSREVGLAHELNSHKMRISRGLKIVQAGRDFFGKKTLADGSQVDQYITEFDAVTEPIADAGKPSNQREVVLWEDKSARVWLPLADVMEQTFLYKLRVYRDNRALIEQSLGGAPMKVAFSVDVGGNNRKAAKAGKLVWDDPRQQELLEHLKASEAALSQEFGFPISFVFVNSHPGEDFDIYNQEPMDPGEWLASRQSRKTIKKESRKGSGQKGKSKRGGFGRSKRGRR